jgi:hypothetical protein
MSPAEREYLAALRRQIAETRRLFSNAQIPEREKMVCRAFLHSMGVGFSEAEISVGASEPTDIAFRGAAFQITEVLDEGRRRSLEHKELEIKYQNVRSARDVMEPWRNPEPMGFPEMVSVTAKRLEEKFAKLGQQGCRGIDALVYIDLLKPLVRYLQAVACLRRLGAGVVGSAAVCAFRFRPPGTGSKRAGWRRSGAIFAFFAAVCDLDTSSDRNFPSAAR